METETTIDCAKTKKMSRKNKNKKIKSAVQINQKKKKIKKRCTRKKLKLIKKKGRKEGKK